jgi:hypothetical protein
MEKCGQNEYGNTRWGETDLPEFRASITYGPTGPFWGTPTISPFVITTEKCDQFKKKGEQP